MTSNALLAHVPAPVHQEMPSGNRRLAEVRCGPSEVPAASGSAEAPRSASSPTMDGDVRSRAPLVRDRAYLLCRMPRRTPT